MLAQQLWLDAQLSAYWSDLTVTMSTGVDACPATLARCPAVCLLECFEGDSVCSQGSAIKKSATIDVVKSKQSRLGRAAPATTGKQGSSRKKKLLG